MAMTREKFNSTPLANAIAATNRVIDGVCALLRDEANKRRLVGMAAARLAAFCAGDYEKYAEIHDAGDAVIAEVVHADTKSLAKSLGIEYP